MSPIYLYNGKILTENGKIAINQNCCCEPFDVCCCEGSLVEAGLQPEDCKSGVFTPRGSRPRIVTKLSTECAHRAEPPAGESSNQSPCSSAQVIVEWCGITLAFPAIDPEPATPYPIDDRPFPLYDVPSCTDSTLSDEQVWMQCRENRRDDPVYGTTTSLFQIGLYPYYQVPGQTLPIFVNDCGNRCVAMGVVLFFGGDGINSVYEGQWSFLRRDGCDAATIVGGQWWVTSSCWGFPDGASTAPCADERPVITVTFAP